MFDICTIDPTFHDNKSAIHISSHKNPHSSSTTLVSDHDVHSNNYNYYSNNKLFESTEITFFLKVIVEIMNGKTIYIVIA